MGSPTEVRKQEACDRHAYLLDAVCKADTLQQKRRVRMDGNSSANLAQFDGLFKDGDLRPTRPPAERGRQAPISAAHDRRSKLYDRDCSCRRPTL